MSDSEQDDIETPTASSEPMSQESAQIEVKLFSSLPERFQVPSDKMVVPGSLNRVDLSEIVNESISLEKRIPFDFIIGGEFLRGSLSSHCLERGILSEKTLEIEYVIAMEEPSTSDLTLPQSDWISGISHGTDVFFTCSMDGVLSKYESVNGKLMGSSQQSALPLTGVALSESGVVTTSCRDGMIRFASSDSLELIEIGKIESSLTCLSLCAWDNSLVLTGSVDGSVHLWNVPLPSAAKPSKSRKRPIDETVSFRSNLLKLDSSVCGISWMSLSRAIATSQDGSVRVFDPMSGDLMPTISIPRNISAMACMGDRKLVTGHPDGRIIFWSMRFDGSDSCSIEAVNSCRSHSRLISSLASRPDSEFMVASACLDGTVKLFDSRASHFAIQSVSLPQSERALVVAWISPNKFLSAGSDCLVRCHDIEMKLAD